MSRVPEIEIPCPKCEGCGKVTLPIEYWATVQIILGLEGEFRVEEIAEKYSRKISPTTIHNQLRKLEAWGLVTSQKKSRREVVWVLKEGGPQ